MSVWQRLWLTLQLRFSDVFALDGTSSAPLPPAARPIPLNSVSKKQHVIDELLATEKDFLDDLDTMIEDIMFPLQDKMVRSAIYNIPLFT